MENRTTETVNLEELYSVGFFMSRTVNAMDKMLNRMFRQNNIDLHCSQFIILRYIYVLEGKTKKEISIIIDKDVATVSRTIDLLEKKGWVRKEKRDHQSIGIFLTEKAVKLRPIIDEILEDLRKLILKDLTEEQRKDGLALLKKLYDNVSTSYENQS